MASNEAVLDALLDAGEQIENISNELSRSY